MSTPETRIGTRSFDGNSRRALGRVLGSRADAVIPHLEALVEAHTVPDAGDRERHLEATRQLDELEEIVSGLRQVVSRIDSASPEARRTLESTLSSPVLKLWDLARATSREERSTVVSDWERLAGIRDAAAAFVQRWYPSLEIATRGRGRPRHEHKRALAHDVALVLRLVGVPVAKARPGKQLGGQFASIFGTVLHEAYGSSPEDVWPLIAEAAAFAHDLTPEGARSVIKRLLPYSDKPHFWRSVLADQVQ